MRPRLGRASGIVERSDTLLELRDAKRVILRRRADRRRDRLALPCLVLPPVTTGGRILPDGASRRARAARRLPFVCISSTAGISPPADSDGRPGMRSAPV